MTSISDTIRDFYHAYHERDRAAASALMDEGFTFTSPYDDAIGKAEWFARCWDPGDHHAAFEEELLVEAGDSAFLTYFLTLDTGLSFRNTEYLVVREGRIVSVTVYFGASYRDGAFLKQEPKEATAVHIDDATPDPISRPSLTGRVRGWVRASTRSKD
jgi:ketosteroid isomerase-like protein